MRDGCDGERLRKLETLFGVFTARAHLRRSAGQDRPSAIRAADHRLSEHAPDQRAASPAATRTGAHPGALAHLLERRRPRLNRFDDGPSADLVAQACGLEILDDRLRSGFLF